MSSPSSILLHLVATLRKVHFDYTPQWTRDAAQRDIIAVTFPRVLVDKRYSYRVVCEDSDLGIRSGAGAYAGGLGDGEFSGVQPWPRDITDAPSAGLRRRPR